MRTEQIRQMLSEGIFAVEPRFLQGVIDTVNNGSIETKAQTDDSVSPSHGYEVVGNIAVITVDGATTKKNTWINAMCGGYVGYDTIANYIGKAEGDVSVEKILFHLDTVGGDVAGVDNLQELIKTSTKETITLYDNIGASAGIWYGTASDKVYATPMTQLGSIGVMGGYYEPREDDKKVVLVSRNASNKNCLLNGDCKNKFQARIDSVEAVFHDRVSANTGLSKEEIISYFNEGDVISSQRALEIGFIDGITSKKDLLKVLSIPPSQTVKPEKRNGKNSTQGTAMSKELQEQLSIANSTIETLTAEIGGKNEKVTMLEAEVATLKEELATANEAKDTASESFKEKMEVIAEVASYGIEMGASKDVIAEAMSADSKVIAENIILKSVASEGATFTGEKKTEVKDNNLAEYAASNAGKVK